MTDSIKLFYIAFTLAVLTPLGMHSSYLYVLRTVCSEICWLIVLGRRDLLLVIPVIIWRIKLLMLMLMLHEGWSI